MANGKFQLKVHNNKNTKTQKNSNKSTLNEHHIDRNGFTVECCWSKIFPQVANSHVHFKARVLQCGSVKRFQRIKILPVVDSTLTYLNLKRKKINADQIDEVKARSSKQAFRD